MQTLASGEHSTGLIKQGDILRIVTGASALVMIFDGDVEIDKLTASGSQLIGPFYQNYRFKVLAMSGSVGYSLISSVEAGYKPVSVVYSGSPNGVVANGKKILDVAAKGNQLINTYPTLRCRPFDRNASSKYTAANASGVGASIVHDGNIIDIVTGLSTAKITIPASNTSYQSVDYYDLVQWQMGSDDVWMFVVYIPVLSSDLLIQILVTDDAALSSNYRLFQWSGSQLQRGYNILTCLHVETFINSSTYGTVGTSSWNQWTNTGDEVSSNQSRSIRVRTKMNVGAVGETVVYFGSIHTAPSGWAKGAVCWMADDVPYSYYELVVPIIESYGWKCTVAAVSQYAGDPSAGANTYSSVAHIRDLYSRGHNVWGHLRLHENADTEDTAGKTTALEASRDFWNAIGIPSAAKYMAWPFGAYDDEAITLAKAAGYKIARSIVGNGINPLSPAINPYNINAFLMETSNSWKGDAELNGSIMRGQCLITYMHDAVAGGSGTNNYPATGKFYVEHFRRWCELVAVHESAGRCIVTTPNEYFNMCGVNPDLDSFTE